MRGLVWQVRLTLAPRRKTEAPVLKLLLAVSFALLSPLALASPGCSGKFWNPLELDFTNIGPIKANILGKPWDAGLKSPLPDPPQHVAQTCLCADGVNTGVGAGLTYWLPSYIMDVAKTPGCIGFLGGIQVMEKFRSLAGTENQHMPRAENFIPGSTRQRHFAHADITSIIGNGFFEKCGSTAKGINIAFMTEVCFPCQSDIWSSLLMPVGQILANNPWISTLACGAVRVASMVGYPIAYEAVCNTSGTRYPLSQTTPAGASSAQEVNTDQIAKHFTLAYLTGGGLRTMGSDTVCRPQAEFIWNPAQYRYQFLFPINRPSMTHLQANKLFFVNGPKGETALSSPNEMNYDSVREADASAPSTMTLDSVVASAQQLWKNVVSPLNFPVSEHAYLQIWEAKTCCLKFLTVKDLAAMAGTSFLTEGGVKKALETVQKIEKVLSTLQTIDSIGTLVAIANGTVSVTTEKVATTTIGAALSPDQAVRGIAEGAGNPVYTAEMQEPSLFFPEQFAAITQESTL